MAAPTLTFSGTVFTLPYPAAGGAVREYDQRAVVRRTIGGRLRTTVLSMGYVYRLAFNGVSQSVYDGLVNLWELAASSGSYPTFSWDYWGTSTDVAVGLEIGAITPSSDMIPSVSFSLTLIEANPR